MKITLFFLLQLAVSAYSLLQEFCVTDLSLPPTPAGYQCRKPSTVTVNDFVFSALDKAANTSNSIKAGVIVALDTQFPALNGVGFSIVRVDFAPGGVIPLHAHNANELLVVIEGTLVAGFIFSSNTAYYKTLRKGDVMVFPEGLLHFQVNTGPAAPPVWSASTAKTPACNYSPTPSSATTYPRL
ncbi:unnamed protein product [Spirodela intermedia]|uniref:Germin-like protein n=1 Tax=Spirodela intermedia TaxID=51605 RepID=A0A7I8LD86_SPIIN|nr:unnamed protein product [Spirodela intermedia]